MDLITSHSNTDLDAMASMIAASLLYPGAQMVFPGKLSPAVEEFMALYKDMFPVRFAREINLKEVTRLILVDTKNPSRLNIIASVLENPGLEIHIFDHHPAGEGDIRGHLAIVDPVGAATTIMVEKLQSAQLIPTPLEATAMALGIYADTGSLLFSSTTPRDVRAVACLLSHGANLAVVAQFIDRPMTLEQNELFKKLLQNAQRHMINGVSILIAHGTAGEYVGGLALLTHKLAEVEGMDAVFTVVEMEDRVYLVGRSQTSLVNVNEILSFFGGGGHQLAASATLKKSGVGDIAGDFLSVVQKCVKAPLSIAKIMSSPVKTVARNTTIESAARVMLRYGHTGLPVVDGEKMVGVISRRDVEKATRHGLGHAPVHAYMSPRVIAISPDDPVQAAQSLMIENDIGRLPVLQDGRLVGIVSRTDILKTMHGAEIKVKHADLFLHQGPYLHSNLQTILYRLGPEVKEILVKAGNVAQRLGYRVYAAGGMIRDLLLNVKSPDIDLVVEGSGIDFAQALAGETGGRVRPHHKFQTAKVFLTSGTVVDVATARIEYYSFPAALPQVEMSSLEQDLYRRDFTINAMAIFLNPPRLGELVDFFGGRDDLAHGLVRVLHNLSFVEDPTRILRAVRFEQRYHLLLEENTRRLLENVVQEKILSRVSIERIWAELRLILAEKNPVRPLKRLFDLQIWPQLLPEVTLWEVHPVLARLPQAIKLLSFWGESPYSEPWLPFWLALVHWTDLETARSLCQRFHFSRRLWDKVERTLALWRPALNMVYDANIKMSGRYEIMRELPREAYPLLAAISEDDAARDRLRQTLQALKENKPSITGRDILALGYRSGPLVGRALAGARQARLDGVISTREEELALVHKIMQGA